MIEDNQKEKILQWMADDAYSPMKATEMAYFMGVPMEERSFFDRLIHDLLQEGKITETKKSRLIRTEKLKLFPGEFIGNARGYGFVRLEADTPETLAALRKAGLNPPNGSVLPDVFIPAAHVHGAMHKDRVLCRIMPSSSPGRSNEAEIVSVLQKGMPTVVGLFESIKNHGFVIPDEKKIPADIHIAAQHRGGAVSGHKVVVELLPYPAEAKNPEGKVIEILGHINEPGVDVLSLVRQSAVTVGFPPDAEEEAAAVPDAVLPEEWEGRADFRDLLTVTIDGEDTKDVDDAISLETLSNGNFRLGVHIADVTHYVPENGPLDKEALRRGTSVYLADRVIPMLPVRLSNGICSLNEGVDRLSVSCVMEVDAKGNLISHRICDSVIRVDKKLTYGLVSEMLADKNGSASMEQCEWLPMLTVMEALSKELKEKRIKQGAIEFGFPEAKIIVDEKGMPTDIRPYERNAATAIIEEFMLLCNTTVAEEYFFRELPFVYRSHEEPDAEKLQKLMDFIRHFGYSIKEKKLHPKAIQDLLAKIEHTPEEAVIGKVILRSLKQARYTPDSGGHFGLAARHYCHFTSPIRRYPDLQIHRIIKESISGLSEERLAHYERILPDVCNRCSSTERTAEQLEREVESLKKAQYMADKIGEEFDGVISGMTTWGMYVALMNTVEGMVSFNNMDDDYSIVESQMIAIGRRTKKTFRLGDRVKVELTHVSEEERRIDFMLVD